MPKSIRAVLTVALMLAAFMQTLDTTIANVALPYMQGSMSASQDEINWVLTSYLVSAAIMTAPTGFLAARFGTSRVFVAAVVGFTFASALCGMARSLDEIVLFRLLQGMCGAALVPLSQSVLFEIYPVEQRASAIAVWGTGVMTGPVIGPIIGGWLTQHYSWRWVFYLNVPFGIAAAIGLVTFLKDAPRSRTLKLDWIGFASLSLAIGAFQTLLDRGETLDWFSSHEIIVETCLAGLGLYIFLVQTALATKPFLSPALFADTNFLVGITLIAVNGLIMFATLALLSPYLEELMNYPGLTAGIVLAPRGVGIILASIASARMLVRTGARPLVAFGLLTGVYALYQITSWTPDISETAVLVAGFIQGISIGFTAMPLNISTFSTLPAALRTEATGIFALMRNIGSALGISVTGAILETSIQTNHAILAANVTPFNRNLQSGAAAHFWNAATSQGAAALDGVITRQASIIAYNDDFRLMLVLIAASVPLAWLLRPERPVVTVSAHVE